MTARAVPLWQSDNPDAAIPPRVQARLMLAAGGRFSCDQCGALFDVAYRMNASRAAKPKFCSDKCRVEQIKARAADSVKARFARFVAPGDPDACWPWSGRRDNRGYGLIDIGGRPEIASRIAYELVAGVALPRDVSVCHSCDNPPCCNPAHLWPGSQRENMRDAVSKGRMHPPSFHGESHPGAKLTAKNVAAIRASGESRRALAARFGVSPQQIANVRSGRHWSDGNAG